MLQGMTGFGSASGRLGRAKILLEIKSLNHKFFEVLLHLPEGLMSLEEPLKKIIAAKVRRGRVSLILNIYGLSQEEAVLNKDIARRYFMLLKELRRQLKIKDSINLTNIMHLPAVFVLEKRPRVDRRLPRILEVLLSRALAQLLRMRTAEGKAISRDLRKRLILISRFCLAAKNRACAVLKEKEKRLPLDEFEIYRKATDVTEEALRINLHLKTFLATLKRDEAVGKELDFIAQELQREANTIGAKCQDGAVSGLVVKIKAEVEKIREQLQNVE